MSNQEAEQSPVVKKVEYIGRGTLTGVSEVAYCASLVWETLYWTLLGKSMGQPVRIQSVFAQMMETGIRAIPIVAGRHMADHIPNAKFVDSLVDVGYDYPSAHAISERICRDDTLVGNKEGLRAEMIRVFEERPRYRNQNIRIRKH